MPPRWWLLVGDWVVLALVMVAGFAFHGTLEASALGRLVGGIMVLALAWTLAAVPTAAVDPERGASPRGWWRWLWATVLAMPLGMLLYEALRGQTVLPLSFVAVMAGFSFLAIAAWRLLYWWAYSRRA